MNPLAGKDAAIITRLVNSCWFFFKWTLILGVLAALVAVPLVYSQLDSQIQKHLQAKLQAHYTGYEVRIGSAKLIKGQGIEIRGLSVAPWGAGEQEKWVEIDEMLAVCEPDLVQLLKDQVEVKRLIVRRPRLRATRAADGTWDVAQLLPLPKFGEKSPVVEIRSARVDLVDRSKSKPCKLALRDINLALTPEETAGNELVRVRGTFGGDHVQAIEIEGVIDAARSAWQFQGGAEGLAIGPELLAVLPLDGEAEVAALPVLRARGTLRFSIRSPQQPGTEPEYRVSCQLAQGRLEDARLPAPLTDLSAQIDCNNAGLTIDQLRARCGQASISAYVQQQGVGLDKPLLCVAQVRNVQLNRHMAENLPDQWQEIWKKYVPTGDVDIEARVRYDGANWHPEITAECRDMSLSYYKFPFRVERGTGQVTLSGNTTTLDLTAYAGDVPITVKGELRGRDEDAIGWVEIRGSHLVTDRRMIAALPSKAQDVVNMLNPSGEFHVYWRGWKNDPKDPELHQHLILSPAGGSMRYEKFPYPLTQVRGTIEMTDGYWTFRDLEAVNDSGFVTCKGEMRPLDDGGSLLALDFAATDVALEDELRDALTPGARQVWKELNPRGNIDLTVNVQYRSKSRQFNLTTRIEPLPETTSLEPEALPYRLEQVQGIITYRDGRIELDHLKAQHGVTRLAAQGTAAADNDGSWHVYFENLTIDRLKFDRDLLLALPSEVRTVVNKLNPSRPVDIRGSFGMAKDGTLYAPLRSRWDLGFYLHQNSVDVGVVLSNVHGMVRLAGNFDGQQLRSRGELAIDSLTYNDLQFTEILGPLWIDNQRVLLGAWAEKEQGRPPRRITAKLYGGTLTGDGWVTLGALPQFSVAAALSGGDLARFARESMPGQQDLSGTVLGNVELNGTARGLNTLSGKGNIRLRNANIYELPLMVQLLKVLRVRVPDSTAFDKGDIQFRVVGPHIYFDTINFLGDAISLFGRGEMDFNQQIRLAFHTTVGRNEVPLLRQLVGEASEQIMQIHVRGDLKNPEITNEAFPAVTQALQLLQGEPRTGPRRTAAGDGSPRGYTQPRSAIGAR